MPSNRFDIYRVPGFGGGLNIADAPENIADAEARRLDNVVMPGTGRITSRPTLGAGVTFPGPVVAIIPFETADSSLLVLTLESGSVKLYKGGLNGFAPGTTVAAASAIGTLAGWTGLTEAPVVTYAIVNERLFMADVKRAVPMTIYQPFDGSGVVFYQPEFDFDGDGSSTTAAAFPSIVREYNNMVFMAGYGAESDVNRPEFLRFSYPGLVADYDAGGDAGDPTETNDPDVNPSAWLFARDDYVMVGTRGVPIVALGSAKGRLLVAKPYETYLLYGTDRDSFRLDLLDPERGVVNPFAMVEAEGAVYWWSNNGPVRWVGSGVEDLAQKISPALHNIDPTKIIATHDKKNHQVLFLYQELGSTKGPTAWLGFDYRRGVWINSEIGASLEVDYIGFTRYTKDQVERTQDAAPPLGAPSNLLADGQSDTTVFLSWSPSDQSAKTKVYVKRSVDVNYSLVRTLQPGGETRIMVSNLSPSTLYDWYVSHEKNDIPADSSVAQFTTLEASVFPHLDHVTAEASTYEEYEAPSSEPEGRPTYEPTVRIMVRLAWVIYSSMYLGPELTYTVERSPNGVDTWTRLSEGRRAGTSTGSYLNSYSDGDYSLEFNTTYFYRVRLENSDGEVGAWSEVSVLTPEEPYTSGGGEDGSGGGGDTTLRWNF